MWCHPFPVLPPRCHSNCAFSKLFQHSVRALLWFSHWILPQILCSIYFYLRYLQKPKDLSVHMAQVLESRPAGEPYSPDPLKVSKCPCHLVHRMKRNWLLAVEYDSSKTHKRERCLLICLGACKVFPSFVYLFICFTLEGISPSPGHLKISSISE